MNRKTLAAAVAEAERFIARAKALPEPTTYEVPGSHFSPFTNDNFPREQGAIRRASMDLTRALADLRRSSMTDPQDLLRLADEVAAYDPRQSPDNRADEMPLDLAIAKAFGRAPADAFVMRGSVTGYGCGDGVGGYGNCPVERYTRSLDAAETLVPEGDDVTGERYRLVAYSTNGILMPMHVRASAWVPGAPRAFAATPALALCAAALKARAHSTKETSNHVG